MISAEDYLSSLRDSRPLWLEGQRITDVTAHPVVRKAVDWVASTPSRSSRARPTRCTACPGRPRS